MIFSGRPDPIWLVPNETAAQLLELWQSMEQSPKPPPAAPPLGYRGNELVAPDGRRWFAYAGIVGLQGNPTDWRRDPDRRFEKMLLASAPAEALPADAIRL